MTTFMGSRDNDRRPFFSRSALARPQQGCEALFEIAFESVHADIWFSKLPYGYASVDIMFCEAINFGGRWHSQMHRSSLRTACVPSGAVIICRGPSHWTLSVVLQDGHAALSPSCATSRPFG